MHIRRTTGRRKPVLHNPRRKKGTHPGNLPVFITPFTAEGFCRGVRPGTCTGAGSSIGMQVRNNKKLRAYRLGAQSLNRLPPALYELPPSVIAAPYCTGRASHSHPRHRKPPTVTRTPINSSTGNALEPWLHVETTRPKGAATGVPHSPTRPPCQTSVRLVAPHRHGHQAGLHKAQASARIGQSDPANQPRFCGSDPAPHTHTSKGFLFGGATTQGDALHASHPCGTESPLSGKPSWRGSLIQSPNKRPTVVDGSWSFHTFPATQKWSVRLTEHLRGTRKSEQEKKQMRYVPPLPIRRAPVVLVFAVGAHHVTGP